MRTFERSVWIIATQVQAPLSWLALLVMVLRFLLWFRSRFTAGPRRVIATILVTLSFLCLVGSALVPLLISTRYSDAFYAWYSRSLATSDCSLANLDSAYDNGFSILHSIDRTGDALMALAFLFGLATIPVIRLQGLAEEQAKIARIQASNEATARLMERET